MSVTILAYASALAGRSARRATPSRTPNRSPLGTPITTAARRAALLTSLAETRRHGHHLVAGVDEAGAGPLAGPLVAAAVLLDTRLPLPSLPLLDDSKRLTALQRARLFRAVHDSPALSVSVCTIPPPEIDARNILNARLLGMSRAVAFLPHAPSLLFVDGDRELTVADAIEQHAVVGGDARVAVVAMAGVVAKEARDEIMRAMDEAYPGYGFGQHAGYATRLHLQRLFALGPCAIHRRSFRPVREAAAARAKGVGEGAVEM